MAHRSNAFRKSVLLSIACVMARTLVLPELLVECGDPVAV
jgi:hypothetical protein